MTVESVTNISDLNATYPAAGDAKSEGDDHIRNLKTGIKTTFPNINGAVSATDEELSFLSGVSSDSTPAGRGIFGASTFRFALSGAEKARITGNGQWLVGSTSSTYFGEYQFSGASFNGLLVNDSAAGGTPTLFAVNKNSVAVFELSATNFRYLQSAATKLQVDSSGNLIHSVTGTAPSLDTNSTMSFELTSNTSLKIAVRGSDGVTRTGTITLS